MSASELVRLALSRLAASRMRALLTMLGIIIGVGSVVALVAVGQGATAGISANLQSLGTNLLTVNAGASTSGFTRGAFGSATTLTVDDAAALAELDGVAALAPELSTSALVTAGDANETASIVGTNEDYARVRNYTVWQGSFLNGVSVDAGLRVAVIGSDTATNLGLGASDVGSDIRIAGIPFQLVGILQPKGTSGAASNDDIVLVPITAVQHYFNATDSVRSIAISVATSEQMDTVKAQATTLLRERHAIASGSSDDFTIADQAQLLESVDSISSLLTILLAGIASISLVVGGIGIMNIMLVSVRERTREIGIRKAIGARGRDILAQFLVEALTLSVIGGLIGVFLGVAVSMVVGQVAGWGFQFQPMTVLMAVGFSLLVGVVFGVWPARQAARLDPIVALRYE
ncbi:MAG: ABC transporter permease [Chloroflexi bacterium]|nr:ABC transporter permease [Chloroflexota bacterium]